MIKYKGVSDIGIVCIDNTRLSPVATVLFRYYASRSKNSAVRSIQFFDAGYKFAKKTTDSAKSFLQQHGFGVSDMLEPRKIDRHWIKSRDLIFTMDRFINRDIIYHFNIFEEGLENKVFILNEAGGIQKRIRDPGEDYNADINSVYLLIEKCCKNITKKLEAAN